MSNKNSGRAPGSRPFQPSPVPWASANPPPPRAASAAATATNSSDTRGTFDETDGALSHYGTFRVDSGTGDSNEEVVGDEEQLKTHEGDRFPRYDVDDDLPDTVLVGRISQYTAPTPSGKIYSQTDLATKAFSSKNPLVIDGINLSQKEIGDLLDTWAIDPVYRESFLESLQTVATDRHALLKDIYKHLKEGFEATAQDYGPEWQDANVRRRAQVESHPIATFSQAVQNKTDKGSFTNHIAHSTLEVYNKYIRQQIEDRGAALQKYERLKVTAQASVTMAREEEKRLNRIKDALLDESLPASGIRTDDLSEELIKFLDSVTLTKADFDGSVVPQASPDPNEMPVINNPGSVSKRNKLIYVINYHTAQLPTVATLGILLSNATVPWSIPPDSAPSATGPPVKFAQKYVQLLVQIGIWPSLRIRALLDNAVQILLRGTPASVRVVGAPKTELSIFGLLRDFVRNNLHSPFLTIAYDRVYLDPELPIGKGDIRNAYEFLTQPVNVLENLGDDQETAVRVLLTPYTPAVLQLANPVGTNVYFSNTIATARATDQRNQVKQMFADIDRILLNPNGGEWKNLQLQLQPPSRSGSPTISSISTELERLSRRVNKLYAGDSSIQRERLATLIESIRTGESLSLLVEIIALMSAEEEGGSIAKIFRSDPKLRRLRVVLKKLLLALQNPRPGVIAKIEEDLRFPIQYHIDARFTILYAILQYEYVRQALFRVLQYQSEAIANQLSDASNLLEKAQTALDKSLDAEIAANDSLTLLNWSQQPANSRYISLSPDLKEHVRTAWSWIRTQTSRNIDWDDDDIKKDIDQLQIIMDVTGSVDSEEVRDFLVDVTAMLVSGPKRKQTTVVANPMSAPQFEQSKFSEAEVREKVRRLRAKYEDTVGKWRLYFLPLAKRF